MTTQQQEVEASARPAGAKRPRRWRLLSMPLRWLIFIMICLVSLHYGLAAREWTFRATDQIHFFSDINRGYMWGIRSARDGYLNIYEKQKDQQPWDNPFIDYAPLRLAVMRNWGQWVLAHYPDATDNNRRNDYEFHQPVLKFNTAISIFGAIGIFLLTRFHIRRSYESVERGTLSRMIRRFFHLSDERVLLPARPRPPFCGNWQGLLAAISFWLNPAVLISAYGWPTWDMWIIPFFVWAAYAACIDAWLLSGIFIAIGAMFKGQQLFIASVFIIWPLLLLQFGSIYRWVCGFLLGFGLIASPWLVTYLPGGDVSLPRIMDWPAIWWVSGAGMSVLAIGVLGWLYSRPWGMLNRLKFNMLRLSILILAIVVSIVGITWPWWSNQHGAWWPGFVFAGIVLFAGLLLRRMRFVIATFAGTIGAALFSCLALFHGSDSWFRCSFLFGTYHWRQMVVGQTSNLPGLMLKRFGWRDVDEQVFTLPAKFLGFLPNDPYPVTINALLRTIFVATFLMCCVGVAMHWRRKDPRFLVALTGTWLMFFCFPTQIHERYLIFAAGVGMTAIAAGFGYYLLGLFMSVITSIMTLHVMIGNSTRGFGLLQNELGPKFGPSLYRFIVRTHPDIGWAVLLCAAVFLYVSLTPGRRRGNADQLRLTQQGV